MSEKEIQKLDRSMADACMRRVKSLEQQNEVQRMQLVACSVISLCNTKDALEQSSNILPEYKCATVDDVITSVKREIELIKANKKIEQQNAELVAHCGVLKSEMANLLWHYKENLNGGTKHMNELIEGILEQTPQQSLANIQADAIDRAIDTSAKVQTYGEDNKCIRVLTLQEYAEEIRKESK